MNVCTFEIFLNFVNQLWNLRLSNRIQWNLKINKILSRFLLGSFYILKQFINTWGFIDMSSQNQGQEQEQEQETRNIPLTKEEQTEGKIQN